MPFEEPELLLAGRDVYEEPPELFGILEIDEREEPLIGTAGIE